jgi:phosphoglycerate dehydrogenase-like enzyme
MTNVIVTDLEYNKAANVFENSAGFTCIPAPSDEAGLVAKIRETGARHVIIGVNQYAAELYEAIPAGGVIARFGVGHDGVDKALAQVKGIHCTNTPGVLDESVAECAIGLMLTAARHLATCAADNRNGLWKNRVGAELSGKTLAVIGCGNIGRKVAKIARYGFGMAVVGFDIVKPDDCGSIDAFTTDFATAVKEADYVTIHLPDIAATRDFINAERLALLKPAAVLVNTARGGVLDESALFDAVQTGRLAGTALDVFKTEPYAPQDADKDLRSLPGVIMTPHIGSSTAEACERMAKAALRNIALCEQGRVGDMNMIIKR